MGKNPVRAYYWHLRGRGYGHLEAIDQVQSKFPKAKFPRSKLIIKRRQR